MHIVPGIVATAHDVGIVQATRSMCGPFVNVAPIQKHYIPSQKHHDRAWAEKCIDFNESVLRYLAATKSIEVVVLASPFRAYVNANEFLILRRGRGESIVMDASISEATRGLQDTIDAIRALGRRVVVIAPPPSQGFDIGACLERRADDKVALGAPADCAVTMAGYKEYYGGVIDLLHRLSVVANVEVIDFDGLLCDASACQTRTGETFIYRDIAHFSYDGSIWMGRKLDLAQRLNAVAR
jgi:hypothetical protein